jgi:hypothetical protein
MQSKIVSAVVPIMFGLGSVVEHLSRGVKPTAKNAAANSSAVCEHAAQSTFTKSPGPRSSILPHERNHPRTDSLCLFVRGQHGSSRGNRVIDYFSDAEQRIDEIIK